MPVMTPDDFDTFLTLAETLKEVGWSIVKYEDHGGGVTLTIVPVQGKEGER